MLGADDSLDLQTLGARLRAGAVRPRDVVAGVLERIAARGDDKVWIRLTPRGALQARAAGLERLEPGALPLYGVPFAIKDNIDCAGEPTTAGVPGLRLHPVGVGAGRPAPARRRRDPDRQDEPRPVRHRPGRNAVALRGVRERRSMRATSPAARAPGRRSPSRPAWSASRSAPTPPGRDACPAAFNNIVGLKPTRGLLSARGVVPACRSLDCVSIFALTADDTEAVLGVAAGFDPADPFARRSVAARPLPASLAECRIGIPREEQLEFFGNGEAERLFRAAVDELVGQGATPVRIDFAPFLETARLLYGGPWVAERYVAIREFFDRRPEALFPVTREIIGSAAKFAAADYFAAEYRLQALRRQVEPVWQSIDVLLTPTAGTAYTIDAVNASPISLNTNLGYYTNFMNLLDLAAIAVPAGFQADGLPFGITLAAPAFTDRALSALGAALHARLVQRLGATRATLPPPPPPAPQERLRLPVVRLAVCGAHMSGLPLNHQLTERGGRLVRRCRTAARYRLFALNAFSPPRPGLLRAEAGGHSIDVEVWALPTETVGSFVDGIPPPLGIGTVELEDGEQVRGFLCESHAAVGAQDISALGSWRTYVDPKKS